MLVFCFVLALFVYGVRCVCCCVFPPRVLLLYIHACIIAWCCFCARAGVCCLCLSSVLMCVCCCLLYVFCVCSVLFLLCVVFVSVCFGVLLLL